MNTQILFFSSVTCGPCILAKKMLTKEIKQELNIKIVPEEDWLEFAKYKIKTVPTFVKLIDNKEVNRRMGFKNIEELRNL